MASAPCISMATFSRCAPGARVTSPTQVRPSRATWNSWNNTSGTALVSTRRRTTPSACNVRPRGAVDGVDDSGAAGKGGGGGGLTLAEVVAVEIGNINNQRAGKLYGTITVTDGYGSFDLYSRGMEDYQVVGPGGKADLVYPPRAISGGHHFVIDVDLMDHYSWVPIADRKVALGRVSWNSRDASPSDYNRILRGQQVRGEYGNVEVEYAVVTDAVVAVVEVEMVESGNRVWPPDVYGSVTARTSMASGEQLQYSLLAPGQYERVRGRTAIPLQRKLVSAPLCSELEVSANLWDNNLLLPDDQIVNGSVVFVPCLDGTNTAEIIGPRGKVRVNVTWST